MRDPDDADDLDDLDPADLQPADLGPGDPEPSQADLAFDRRFRLALLGAWLVVLAVVVVRGMDPVLFVLASAYALGIAYSLHLRSIGDPEGESALPWAIVVPPLAWWTLLLLWLERRGRPIASDPDQGPIAADADLGYGPDDWGHEVPRGS